ncbi:MAG TPA: hypothetical protein OIM11_02825 [Coriobacteriaceae bacterium]|nr:hypothetical protein [Coriobacteriaceae bacterium]
MGMTCLDIWLIFTGFGCLIGISRLVYGYYTVRKDQAFFEEYANHFMKYTEDIRGKEVYEDAMWLIQHGDKMAEIMGEDGYVTSPMAGLRSVPLHLVNYLCSLYFESLPSDSMIEWNLQAALPSLISFEGILGERRKKAFWLLVNPLNWIIEGVCGILRLPLYILQRAGLFGVNAYAKASNSLLFRLLSGLATLITVFSPIVGFVVNWLERQTY